MTLRWATGPGELWDSTSLLKLSLSAGTSTYSRRLNPAGTSQWPPECMATIVTQSDVRGFSLQVFLQPAKCLLCLKRRFASLSGTKSRVHSACLPLFRQHQQRHHITHLASTRHQQLHCSSVLYYQCVDMQAAMLPYIQRFVLHRPQICHLVSTER
jgi:hypothetical protein